MVKETIEITSRSSNTGHDARVRNLRVLCVLLVVVLLLAIWAFLPYLVVEHRRLETWKIVGLWSGDFIGLLWFSRFAYVQAILGESFASLPLSWDRLRLRPIMLACVAALLMDLSFTLLTLFLNHA